MKQFLIEKFIKQTFSLYIFGNYIGSYKMIRFLIIGVPVLILYTYGICYLIKWIREILGTIVG